MCATRVMRRDVEVWKGRERETTAAPVAAAVESRFWWPRSSLGEHNAPAYVHTYVCIHVYICTGAQDRTEQDRMEYLVGESGE